MSTGEARLKGLNAAGLMLVVLALVVRLAFPTGYMLSPVRSELPTIVICTGQGAMTLAVDENGQAVRGDPASHPGKSGEGKTSHPCTFSVATAAFAAPLLIAVAAPMIAGRLLAPVLTTTQRPGLGLAAPPPPKTGPPARF